MQTQEKNLNFNKLSYRNQENMKEMPYLQNIQLNLVKKNPNLLLDQKN